MNESSPGKIEFKVRFTFNDIYKALVQQSWLLKNWLTLVCASALLLIIAFVFAIVPDTIIGPKWSEVRPIMWQTFLYLGIFQSLLTIPGFQMKHEVTKLMKTPSFSGEMHIVLDADGMETDWTEGHSAVKWGHFVSWSEQQDVFCLFTHSRVFHIIPKRYLSEAEITQVRELLGRQIKGKRNDETRSNLGKYSLISALVFIILVLITFIGTVMSMQH